MTRQEELEKTLRMLELISRLKACRERIGKMCSEKRPPRMTVPVQWTDDDFFISTTINDAIKAIESAKKCLEGTQ